MFIILACAMVVLAGWTFLNPFVGLITLLGVDIIQPGELYPNLFGPLHVERVFVILVFLSFLIHHRRAVFPPPTKGLLFFWGTLLMTVPLAFWRGGALMTCVLFGRIVIYYFLIANLVNTPRRFRVVLLSLSAFVGWLAASSAFLYYQGQFKFTMGIERAVGLTTQSNDANALAITLLSTLPLMLLLWFKGSGKTRWIALGLTFLSLWTLILTGSRAAFFGLLMVTILFALTRRLRIVYALAIVFLAAPVWLLIPAQYKARYESVTNLQQDDSYEGRVRAWEAAWAMFKGNPLTGVGAGMFTSARGATSGHWLNVHSLYMQLLSETGIIGTIGFAVFVGSIFRQNQRLRRQLSRLTDRSTWLRFYPVACNFSLIALLITGYSSHSLFRETWYILAGLSAAAGLVAAKELRAADRRQADKAAMDAGSPAELAGVRA